MRLIARVTAAVDAAGTTRTLLFGTEDWTTGPTDAPAHEPVRGRLVEAANYRRDMGDGRTLFGAVRPGYGAAVIDLRGGQLDAVARYGFGWRAYDLFWGGDGYDTPPPFPAGWTQLLSCTIESAEFDDSRLVLRLRDPLMLLDKPLCTLYAGTGGAEGPAQLAGQPKPRLYGQCCNVQPVLVDSANLIYQLSDRPYSQPRHVYDRRDPRTPLSANYNDAASFAALQALAVSGSDFARWSDGGMFKLGGSPVGTITADGIRHDAAYATSFGRPRIGEVLADVAADAGLSSGQIDPALAALEAGGGPSHGLFARDASITYLDALRQLAASRGAWVAANRLGVLTGGVVAAPSGSPVWTFGAEPSAGLARVTGPMPVPAKAVTVRGGRNWTPMQPSDVAGISVDQVEAIGRTHLYTERATGSAGAKHLNARDETVDTLSGAVNVVVPALPGNSVGMTPASWMSLFGRELDWFDHTGALSGSLVSTVDIGSVVWLQWPRFGLDAGRLALVTGVRHTYERNRITHTLLSVVP